MIRAAVCVAVVCAASPALAQRPILEHPDLPVAGTANPDQLAALRRLVAATAKTDRDLADLRFRLASELQKSASATDRADGRALLEEILVKHPGFARRDEVIYQLALAAQAANDTVRSRRLFKTLIKNHPRSSHIPGAYCIFGDYFFDQKSMTSARRFYERVMQFPRAPVANYARYKLGWVAFLEGKHQEALELFYRVHSAARRKDPQTEHAAREGLVFAYARVGKWNKAHAFFRRVDRGNAQQMQTRLAEQYAAEGKHAEAIASYRELIARSPRDVMICDWQAGVARSTSETAGRRATAREIQRLREIGRRLGRPLCQQLADSI